MLQVRFFASLSEDLSLDDQAIEWHDAMTVAEVWQQCTTAAMPANTLMAINQEYAKAEAAVQDGDEVAFFPPVTGG